MVKVYKMKNKDVVVCFGERDNPMTKIEKYLAKGFQILGQGKTTRDNRSYITFGKGKA